MAAICCVNAASAQICRPLGGVGYGVQHARVAFCLGHRLSPIVNSVNRVSQFPCRSWACAALSNVCKTTTASTSVWVAQWIVESSCTRFRSAPGLMVGIGLKSAGCEPRWTLSTAGVGEHRENPAATPASPGETVSASWAYCTAMDTVIKVKPLCERAIAASVAEG